MLPEKCLFPFQKNPNVQFGISSEGTTIQKKTFLMESQKDFLMSHPAVMVICIRLNWLTVTAGFMVSMASAAAVFFCMWAFIHHSPKMTRRLNDTGCFRLQFCRAAAGRSALYYFSLHMLLPYEIDMVILLALARLHGLFTHETGTLQLKHLFWSRGRGYIRLIRGYY